MNHSPFLGFSYNIIPSHIASNILESRIVCCSWIQLGNIFHNRRLAVAPHCAMLLYRVASATRTLRDSDVYNFEVRSDMNPYNVVKTI